MIIVCSLPCSGSTFTNKILRKHGLDIGHEGLGLGGGSGYNMGPTAYLRRKNSDLLKDATWVHQVRDPLKVISSLHGIPSNIAAVFCTDDVPEISPEVVEQGEQPAAHHFPQEQGPERPESP